MKAGLSIVVLLDLAISSASVAASYFLNEHRIPQLPDGQIPVHLVDDVPVPPVWHTFVTRPDLRPPIIHIEGPGSPGLLFLTPRYSVWEGHLPRINYNGLLIADTSTGDIIWATNDDEDGQSDNLMLQKYLGRDVLVHSAWGCQCIQILDNSYEIIERVDPTSLPLNRSAIWQLTDGHDFIINDEKHMIVLVRENVPYNLTDYGGPEKGFFLNSRIRRIDLNSREVLMEWSSMDHISLSESLFPIPPSGGGTLHQPWDYIHVNSLDIHPVDGTILMSARHTSALYKINSSTGDLIWRLGGKRSDFIMGENSKFQAQHHARWILASDNEISLFDNHVEFDIAPPGASRGVIISLDFEHMICSLKTEFKHPDNPHAIAEGSMQLLPDGGAFVGYRTDSFRAEFNSRGGLISTYRFQVEGEANWVGSYRMMKYSNWTPIPATIPDVAFVNGTYT